MPQILTDFFSLLALIFASGIDITTKKSTPLSTDVLFAHFF